MGIGEGSERAAARRAGISKGDYPKTNRVRPKDVTTSSHALSPSSDPPYSAFIRWYTVAVLTFMYALAFLDRQIMSLMVAPIRADLGITDFQISLLHGFGFAIFYTLFGLPIGFIVDRLSRRHLIYFGITAWSIATAICGLTRNFPQFLLARMGVGAGEAVLIPAANSIISDMFSKRRVTLALSVFACGGAIGVSISLVLVGHLLAENAAVETIALPFIGALRPWQFIFVVVGLPGIILAFLIFTLPEPIRRDRMSMTKLPLAETWRFMKGRKKFFACVFTGFSLILLTSYSTVSWLPTYMMRHFGWPIDRVAVVISVTILASVPLTMMIGWFVDRRYRAGQTDAHLTVYAILILVCAVLFICGGTTSSGWLAVIFIGGGLGLMAYIGVASAAMQIVTPNEFRGQVSVLFMFATIILGQGIGPSVPAAFTDFLFQDDAKVGWSIALTAAICVPLWRPPSYGRAAVPCARRCETPRRGPSPDTETARNMRWDHGGREGQNTTRSLQRVAQNL